MNEGFRIVTLIINHGRVEPEYLSDTKGPVAGHRVWAGLAVTSRFGNLSVMTSQVGVSTWMCDGQMSSVCYSPLGGLIN